MNWVIFDSGNGLSLLHSAITWTNADLWSTSLLRINFNEIGIKFRTFSFKKIHVKTSSAKFIYGSLFKDSDNSLSLIWCQAITFPHVDSGLNVSNTGPFHDNPTLIYSSYRISMGIRSVMNQIIRWDQAIPATSEILMKFMCYSM